MYSESSEPSPWLGTLQTLVLAYVGGRGLKGRLGPTAASRESEMASARDAASSRPDAIESFIWAIMTGSADWLLRDQLQGIAS